MIETQVQTVNGWYTIPTGERGTAPWVRQASLIAVAYRDAGDTAKAYEWLREYEKRRLAYERIQNGADMQAILTSIGPDLLAPFRIAAKVVTDVASGVGDVARGAGEAARGIADVLPLLLVGALVVVAVIGSKAVAR